MADPQVLTAVVTEQSVEVIVPASSVNITSQPSSPVAVVTVEGPPGARGQPGTSTQIIGETPTGVQDGTNGVFHTAHNFQAGTLALYRNGIRENKVDGHYTEQQPNILTLSVAPKSDDDLSVDYLVS